MLMRVHHLERDDFEMLFFILRSFKVSKKKTKESFLAQKKNNIAISRLVMERPK